MLPENIFSYFFYADHVETCQSVTDCVKIPNAIPEKSPPISDSGKIFSGFSFYYSPFDFITSKNQKQRQVYGFSGESVSQLQPDSLIKGRISKKRIIYGPG